MNAFRNPLSLNRHRTLFALDRWQRALDDEVLRRDCPDAYLEELIRQADEMDRLGLVSWQKWRDLRRVADRAYHRSVAGADYHA